MDMPFIFGGNTGQTPQSIAAMRAVAESLAARGTAPHNLGEGLSAIGDALAYRGMMGQANKAESAGQASVADSYSKLLGGMGGNTGGGGAPAAASAAPSPNFAAGPQPAAPADANPAFVASKAAGDMGNYANSISGIESGGKYDLLGPVTGGDRAYGKYQVMGANIPEWTKAALGASMTPEQFLASPQAQDAVFNHQFGGYVQKYGNPQDAASAWFTGGPQSTGAGKSDVLGTTGRSYVDQFNKGLGASPGIAAVAGAMPQQGGPDMRAITAVLGNPFSTPGQKAVAQALLERQMAQSDPMAAAARATHASEFAQTQQLERDKLAQSASQFQQGLGKPVPRPYLSDLVNPITGEVVGGAGSTASSIDPTEALRKYNLVMDGDQASRFAQVPDRLKSTVAGLLGGTMVIGDIPGGQRNPMRLDAINAAKSVDPTYDEVAAKAGQTFETSKTTQQFMANGRTASATVDRLIELSNKIDRGNITFLNNGQMALRSGTSDTDTKAFLTEYNILGDELGKILGSGQGSDFAIKLGQSLVDPTGSKASVTVQGAEVKGRIANKLLEYKNGFRQGSSIQAPPQAAPPPPPGGLPPPPPPANGITVTRAPELDSSSGGAPLPQVTQQPAPGPAPSPYLLNPLGATAGVMRADPRAMAAPGSVNRMPSPAAVQALQADPGKAGEFDAYYGAGSAMKFLGR